MQQTTVCTRSVRSSSAALIGAVLSVTLERSGWPDWATSDWFLDIAGSPVADISLLYSVGAGIGRDGRVFRTKGTDGAQHIVKCFVRTGMAKRQYKILASVATDPIPSPSPLGSGAMETHDGAAVVMEDLPGLRWYDNLGSWDLDPGRVDASAACMHDIASLDVGKPGWRRYSPDHWPEAFHADVSEYRQKLPGSGLPELVRKAIDVLEQIAKSGMSPGTRFRTMATMVLTIYCLRAANLLGWWTGIEHGYAAAQRFSA